MSTKDTTITMNNKNTTTPEIAAASAETAEATDAAEAAPATAAEAAKAAEAAPATAAEATDAAEAAKAAPASAAPEIVAAVPDKDGLFDVFSSISQQPAKHTDTVDDGLHICNVVRDGDSVIVKVYKIGSQRTMTVHYDGEKDDKVTPYVEGVKKYDKLSDGGLVVAVNSPSTRQLHAELSVSIEELMDKFPEKFSALSFALRHRNKKSNDNAKGGEA